MLQVLIERIGVDRLVMGSDYPVGEPDMLGWLRRCGLQGEPFEAVAGGNALRLLDLPLAPSSKDAPLQAG